MARIEGAGTVGKGPGGDTGRRSGSSATLARCTTPPACRCGQQLDQTSRAHCPRCGRSLQRP